MRQRLPPVLINLPQGKSPAIISSIITNRCVGRAVTPKKVITRNRITYSVRIWGFTHGGDSTTPSAGAPGAPDGNFPRRQGALSQ